MERLKAKLRKLLAEAIQWTTPRGPSQTATINRLNEALVDLAAKQDPARVAYMERVAELVEARQMAGSGPWRVSDAALQETDRLIDRALKPVAVRESANAITAQGVYGDIELALQNVEWRREVNLSWLEFSRWGIQQLILICRLYYVKHPWIRRGINLSAAYVFGQGVELSSPDPDANKILTDFRERNKCALGQIALSEQEKRKNYDGNVFWCLFTDTNATGQVNVRVIDATEIQEIVYDPEDSEKPQYYRRLWTNRAFDILTGTYKNLNGQLWYPALGFQPEGIKPTTIGGIEVKWDSPVLHRKCGAVANWSFGCPRVYPAIDWAKEGRKHLEACAAVVQAHAQIANQITTKGGQQALEGIKNQLSTSVGPTSALWDQNPPAVAGSTFASGPGTTLQAFKSRGTGPDPAEVKELRNMVACAMEIPPTWLADMETSNLSTAMTLDRPTELGFMSRQEEWQEDLVTMGRYALDMSKRAPKGRLREILSKRVNVDADKVNILEAKRVERTTPTGARHWVYEAAKQKKADVIEVLATFPAIREGDAPAMVKAVVEAMTLDNKGGQVTGIDEKAGVRRLYEILGFNNADELTEDQYPDDEYDPDRTTEILPPPIPKTPPPAGGSPQPAPADVKTNLGAAAEGPAPKASVQESRRIRTVIKRIEAQLVSE